MTAKDLTTAYDAYAADELPQDASTRLRVQIRRAYMAGAAQAVLLAKEPDGLKRAQADLVAFGRTVGTPIERTN